MSYNISKLMEYARGKEENYNKVGNILYKNFNICNAELTLVSLFVYEEMKKKEEKERQKRRERQMNQSKMCEMCKKYVFDYQIVVGRTYRKKAVRYYCNACMSKIIRHEEVKAWERKNNTTT